MTSLHVGQLPENVKEGISHLNDNGVWTQPVLSEDVYDELKGSNSISAKRKEPVVPNLCGRLCEVESDTEAAHSTHDDLNSIRNLPDPRNSVDSVLCGSWHEAVEISPEQVRFVKHPSRAARTSLSSDGQASNCLHISPVSHDDTDDGDDDTPPDGDRFRQCPPRQQKTLVFHDRGGEEEQDDDDDDDDEEDDDDDSTSDEDWSQEDPVQPAIDEERKEDEHGDDEDNQRMRRRLTVAAVTVLVCYFTGYMSLMQIFAQYLFRHAALEHFNMTNVTLQHTPCGQGDRSPLQDDLNQLQASTSRQLFYFNLCLFIPAVFVALVVGSYADYIGRKLLILVPVFGGFLKALVVSLVVHLELDVSFLYLSYCLDGVLGSVFVLQIGLFAAIADVIISSRQRVVLFGMLEIGLALAGTASQIGTGFLIEALGFLAPSLATCCLSLVACIYIGLFMPETLRHRPHLVLNPVFHLRKVFGFYFWEGTLRQRALFSGGQVILFLISMVNLGRMPVETLFEMNSPFCWGPVQIGLVTGIRLLLQNMAGVVTLKVMSRCVRIELIGMLGLMSGVAGFIVQSMADRDLMMYISIGLGLIITVVTPVARTLLSRMAPAERQGALFASLCAVETLCHLAASSVYNNVYTATVDVFPGAVFALMAALLLLDGVLLILFVLASRNVPHLREVQAQAKTSDPTGVSSSQGPRCSRQDDETTPLLQTDSGSSDRHAALQQRKDDLAASSVRLTFLHSL